MPDINKKTEQNGNTFLHYVAAKCDDKLMLKLLGQGADIMLTNKEEDIPVELAIKNKKGELNLNSYFPSQTVLKFVST